MNHKKHHQPIRVEKINRSAEEINYLLSTIQNKIDKSEFPNYHVPFSALTPEQKAELRGPQGNSGIIGDINNIAIEAVNDLNGGESTPGTLRVLSAEQGKVLNQVAQTNKQNITNLTLVVGEIIELMKEYQFKDMGEFHLEEDVNAYLFMTPDIGFFSFIINSEKTPPTSFSFVKHISLSQIVATEYLALRNGTELGWLAVDIGAPDCVDFIATPHPYSLATILAQQKNILEQHIDSNNKHISAIDRNLSDLERTVTANKNELDEDVANLYEGVETVATKVQTIEIDVDHHNDDISHLQGDVRKNTNNITALGSRIDALGSVYNIQGTKPSLAQLLAITSAKKGDVYSIDSEFYLAGKFYPASTNVVCVTAFTSASDNKASCWDPLGGTFNASLYLEKSKAAVVNPSDLTESLERIEDITYTEKGKEFVSGGAVGSVLPFKLISKTTLDNGYTAWYRLALNYPTGSSNGAHQLLLQYAETTTIPTEADWKTINYINNISLSSLLSSRDVANNLTTTASGKVLDARQGKTLADAIANKQDTLVSGKNISTINGKDLLSGEDIIIETPSSSADIAGLLNIKDAAAVAEVQNLLTEDGQTATYIITDHDGNYPSPNVPLVYLDDMAQLRDLLYRGNDKALAYLLDTKEAYYQYGSTWYSQNIAGQVKLPTFNLTTARVGDLVTIIRHEFTANEFYNKYIDFSGISNDNLLFQAYKAAQGYGDKTDGEFIQYLIESGNIYSAPSNPEEDETITPVPLAVNGNVVLYTAQITPNVNTVFSGEFWSGNINAPGIYCYVTSGRPAGVPSGENFIGVVSPDGTKMLLSMKNPSNNYIFRNGNWQWIGVGKNTGGTGEIFNDYTNTAHSDHGHAEGQKTYASWNSHAEGFTTQAGSDSTGNAHSEGNTTQAIGNNSHAEGINTVAEGHNSHAEGDSTQATNWNAHAEGYRTHATGNGAHAEGNSDGIDDEARQNVASGFASHVEGCGTVASEAQSHAEGYLTFALGKCSHAEGAETTAFKPNSHAEGKSTQAAGECSHAEGIGTQAHGRGSHAEGYGTFAPGIDGAHAEGKYNFTDHNFIHAVGIGTSDTDRKDAHTITLDGKHYIYGVGGYDGTNINAAKDVANVINKNVHLSFFTMNEFTEEEGYEYPSMDRILSKRQVLYIESDQPLTGKLCFAKYQRRKIQWNNRKGWIKDKNRVRRIEGEHTYPHTLFGFSYVVAFSYELDRRENDRYIYKINMSVKLQDGTVKNYSAISIDHLVYIELPSDDPLTVQGTMGDSTLKVKTTSGNNRTISDYTIEGTDDDKPNRGTTLKYGFFLTSEDDSNDTEIFPVTIGIDSTIQQNKILAKNWRRWVFLKK